MVESSRILEAVLNSPPDIVIFALDREYRYLAFNENHRLTMARIWDVDIKVGQCMLEVIGRDDDRQRAQQNFDRALAGESFTLIENYGDEGLERRTYRDVYSPIRNEAGDVVGLTLYLTDVTESERNRRELDAYRERLEALVDERTQALEDAQAQMLHNQKVESLGVMAGGIAHDFNNLLMGIMGLADLAVFDLDSGLSSREWLNQIRQTAQRGAGLTRQMLAYAGRSQPCVEQVSLSRLIDGTKELLRVVVPETITLEFDLPVELPPISADSGQLQQMLLNLVTNAVEAISPAKGRIRVATSMRELDKNELPVGCTGDLLESGPFVVMCVEDNGRGISADSMSRIFDPFFSTKALGTGLGLSTTLGIARSHHGAVCVRSKPGQGSEIGVLLPVARGAQPERLVDNSVTTGLDADQQTALIVEDQEAVRDVVAHMLTHLGFEVRQATDGVHAMQVLRELDHAPDLIVLDMTMPRMGGEQLMTAMREAGVDSWVLLTSGDRYDAAAAARTDANPRAAFLAKPFTCEQLSSAIVELCADR